MSIGLPRGRWLRRSPIDANCLLPNEARTTGRFCIICSACNRTVVDLRTCWCADVKYNDHIVSSVYSSFACSVSTQSRCFTQTAVSWSPCALTPLSHSHTHSLCVRPTVSVVVVLCNACGSLSGAIRRFIARQERERMRKRNANDDWYFTGPDSSNDRSKSSCTSWLCARTPSRTYNRLWCLARLAYSSTLPAVFFTIAIFRNNKM